MSTTDENVAALTEEVREVVTEAGQEALIELITDGLDPEEAEQLLVQVLDGILIWKLFLEDPLASILEEQDGPAIGAAINAIPHLLEVLKPDPDKIEARAQRAEERGHPKVAARRYARAERVRKRQEAREG